MASSSLCPITKRNSGSSPAQDLFIDEMNTYLQPSVGFEHPFSPSDNERGSRQMPCMFGSDGDDCRTNSVLTEPGPPGFVLRRDSWVMPMLGLSAMNVLVILAFEIFVICKATGNSPSRRYVHMNF